MEAFWQTSGSISPLISRVIVPCPFFMGGLILTSFIKFLAMDSVCLLISFGRWVVVDDYSCNDSFMFFSHLSRQVGEEFSRGGGTDIDKELHRVP
jgi:hypothetical protein